MKLADTTGAHRRPHLGSADASVPLGRPQPSRSPARSRRVVRCPRWKQGHGALVTRYTGLPVRWCAEGVEHGLEERREPGEFLQICSTEIGEDLVAVRRKPQAHDEAIVGVSLTLDEPGTLAAIDELDCGVGSDQKIVGHLADGWTTSMIAPRYPSARNA